MLGAHGPGQQQTLARGRAAVVTVLCLFGRLLASSLSVAAASRATDCPVSVRHHLDNWIQAVRFILPVIAQKQLCGVQ
jgi:hypothetical protein